MSNLGWAAHVTHHSSNDYNLSTALRQGVGESMVGGRCNCVVCVGGGAVHVCWGLGGTLGSGSPGVNQPLVARQGVQLLDPCDQCLITIM